MVEKSHTAGHWPGFYEPLRNIGHKMANWFAPSSEASVMGDCYEINIELPGVRAEDIDVSLNDNNLTVRGEKRSQHESKGKDYFFSEREYGAFERTFRLPPDSSGDEIDANFADGVLSLKIAKKTVAKQKSKKISIRSE